jgi:hypothetical protein
MFINKVIALQLFFSSAGISPKKMQVLAFYRNKLIKLATTEIILPKETNGV